jgi:hypothetical protein
VENLCVLVEWPGAGSGSGSVAGIIELNLCQIKVEKAGQVLILAFIENVKNSSFIPNARESLKAF